MKQFLSSYSQLCCALSSTVMYGSTCFEDFTGNYVLTVMTAAAAALTVFKSPSQVRIEIKNILKEYPSSVQQIDWTVFNPTNCTCNCK